MAVVPSAASLPRFYCSSSGRNGTSLGASRRTTSSASLAWFFSVGSSRSLFPATPLTQSSGSVAPLLWDSKVGIVRAAWTRRSRNSTEKKPNRKSWKQRTDMYMRPFILDVFFSRRFIHAKVMHRGTCKMISAASTNADDMRYSLPSLIDDHACRVIGQMIADRCKDADVFAICYEPRKNARIEGKLKIIIDAIKENDIIFVE